MPYITPEIVMRGRFDENPRPEWKTAVLCFRDLTGSRLLVQGLGARPLGYQVLSGRGEFPGNPLPDTHELVIGQAKVGVIANCGWGGPQAAMLVEELAYIGVTRIIGSGAVGSFDPTIPKGSQVVAQVALTTDGTSQAYTDAPELRGDPRLCSLAQAAGERPSTGVRMVCAVTYDALYRETEADVEAWAKQGAQVVNMETSALYAASATCGISSVWLGHVSDCVRGSEWEEWSDIEDMTATSAKIALEMLIRMHSCDSGENDEA